MMLKTQVTKQDTRSHTSVIITLNRYVQSSMMLKIRGKLILISKLILSRLYVIKVNKD